MKAPVSPRVCTTFIFGPVSGPRKLGQYRKFLVWTTLFERKPPTRNVPENGGMNRRWSLWAGSDRFWWFKPRKTVYIFLAKCSGPLPAPDGRPEGEGRPVKLPALLAISNKTTLQRRSCVRISPEKGASPLSPYSPHQGEGAGAVTCPSSECRACRTPLHPTCTPAHRPKCCPISRSDVDSLSLHPDRIGCCGARWPLLCCEVISRPNGRCLWSAIDGSRTSA